MPASSASSNDTSAVPFLRLSNRHITATLRSADPDAFSGWGFASLCDLGLYAMLAAVLSNPSFTYANGGMQQLLLRHTKNRFFSLHNAFRRLQNAGYLIRTRIPEGKNCFRDFYTPLHTADTGAKAARNRCLTASAGAQYRASHQPFLPPTEDFTMVSIPMLMDPSLSLAAKGLYIVIARYLRLRSYRPSLALSKDLLRRQCREGANAFDRIFRELRSCGYLTLTRSRDAKTGYPCYDYSLHASAASISCTDMADNTAAASADECSRNADQVSASAAECGDRQSTATPKTQPKPPLSRTAARQAVHAQIEYDCLLAEYPPQRLDCIVSILLSYLQPGGGDDPVRLGGESCTRDAVRGRFAALDSEDIRYVLDTYQDVSRQQKIKNIRGYLTTCLYHAKENLMLALDSFANRTPGAHPT